MSRRPRTCAELEDLYLRAAGGEELPAELAEALREHLAGCPRCKAIGELFEAVSEKDGDPGPLGRLDEIAERRFVDGALDLLDRGETAQSDEGARGRMRRRLRLSVAAAALVAAGVAVSVFLVFQGNEDGAPLSDPAFVRQLGGELLLISDQVTLDGAEARIGDSLAAGKELRVRDGRALVRLDGEIVISVGDRSQLKIRRLDERRMVCELVEGEVAISATPGRAGPPLEIEAPGGVVRVTGTVLAVSARSGGTTVAVVRGRVEVEDCGLGGKRSLGSLSRVELGGGEIEPCGVAESAAILARTAAAELVSARGAAIVELTSLPAGVDVHLDGAPLGKTPLTAGVKPGHRKLELVSAGDGAAADDSRAVTEIVDLYPGQTLSRTFDLSPEAVAFKGEDTARESAGGAGAKRETDGPGPVELLERAQRLRERGEHRRAARALRELLRRFPDSGEASSSLVSLGRMELDLLGDPASALGRFERYLERYPHGPLALEALWSKARALRLQRRVDAERRALERFVARFPGALQAERARERLDASRSQGE
ncbi:MAG: FecR domain-containing protein [Polyangia bacterium]